MKNVLTHKNGSAVLLANVDDGTNRLFINDEEIPSSQWVGSGNYTKTIDGVTISITKIANLSGNIVLKKVTDTSFRLVKKAEALQQSYIGMITTSTTLDTLEKVREVFGSDTTWIQHSGYMLRGAASGVVANSAAKTGGADTHILTETEIPAHTHGSKSLTGTADMGAGNAYEVNNDGQVVIAVSGIVSSRTTQRQTLQNGSLGYIATYQAKRPNGISINATHTHTSVGGGGAHNNVPNYKNVYIWERTA